jgi:hypothetical protein
MEKTNRTRLARIAGNMILRRGPREDMKRLWALGLVVLFGWAGRATAQVPSNDESAPLVLVRIIAMPDVQGRFDHMGVDNKTNRVFAAVYGNDSVEVLDVARGRRVHSMQAEFVRPQMALYLPDLNRIIVSNEGDGACKVFDADTYKLLDTVKFEPCPLERRDRSIAPLNLRPFGLVLSQQRHADESKSQLNEWR